jgi:intracellular multiplication protein IcmK
MTTNTPFLSLRTGTGRYAVSRLALTAALVCFAANGAQAQTAATPQQLPDTLVNQQIPPSFPQDGAPAAANTTPQTAQTPDVPTTAPVGKTPAVQTTAPTANVQETPDGNQTATETTPVPTQAAQTPPADEIPAQPEQKALVPSTQMGANAASAEPAPEATAQEALPNPVEDAAAAADLNAETAPADPQSSGLPDALEQYTQDADGTGAEDAATGDALPEVNNVNMVKLRGDFPNSNTTVSVPVDGAGQKSSAELQQEIRTEAFDAAITGMFPLSPEQIETLMKKYDTTQKSVTKPPFDAPKPEVSVQNISLDPGVSPPVIKTAVGNVTTINMLDATGAPWPVQDVTWAGDFEIVEPEEGGHIIRITPMSHFARGNIVIRMLTLKTPLTMTLETSREVVQYRVDARVPEYGPFANAPLMQGAKSTLVAGSPDLTSLLDGVMPGGMVKLDVAGVDGRTTAYSMNGTTYVRTPLTLLSPAWQSSVASADGMNVYALSDAPVILLSDGGEFQRATLKEKEDLLDE